MIIQCTRSLLIALILLCISHCDNFAYSNKRKEIQSVAGSVGQLPCYVDWTDDVAMILWFKEPSGTPIYSYDGRNEQEPPRHLPLKNELGLRLHFRVPSKSSFSSRPPALLIRDLKTSDSGSYRCRIDYRLTPTSNAIIRLHVIQPPTHLEIQDASQSRPISDQQSPTIGIGQPEEGTSVQNDITYLGPYIEGQNVTIVCTAFGGMPLPEVIWYRNGNLVDWSYDVVLESVTNTLAIRNLERNHSHDLYTCQASNNNETKPISHRVNVDVYSTVKQIEVEIPDQLTAGVEYNFLCRTKGSYPAVKLEFWSLQKRIGPRYQTKTDADNVTTYAIPFKPEVTDNDIFVTCRAENPWISQNFMEAGRKLHVVYPPIAVLRFGSSKRTNFSEGESLLLECHAKANPPLTSITWYHQGRVLVDNLNGGIELNGMTLVLRHLTHTSGGSYACEVGNDMGKGLSNFVRIHLNISPKCSTRPEKAIPLAIGETHQLQCNILAWPPDLNFYWTHNRSGDILPMSGLGQIIKLNLTEEELKENPNRIDQSLQDRTEELSRRLKLKNSNSSFRDVKFEKSGIDEPLEVIGRNGRRESEDVEFNKIFHQSLFSYRVNSQSDYGLVGCWAKNSYGKQIFPCLFHIVSRDEFDGRSNIKKIGNEINQTDSNMGEVDDTSRWFHKVEETTVFNKLHPTYSIILIGVLIFITVFCLTGFTLWFLYVKRRRAATSTVPLNTCSNEISVEYRNIQPTEG